jgi:energy-coupling factor transporter ATP-binding protein EcfA2
MSMRKKDDGVVPKLAAKDRVLRYAGDCDEVLRNPFLAALYPKKTKVQWIAALTREHRSAVSEVMTDSQRELRIGLTHRMHVPLSREILAVQALERLLWFGYHCRFGAEADKSETDQQSRDRILGDVLEGNYHEIDGQTALAVIGVSGSGKSSTLRAGLKALPKVLWHTVAREGEPRVVQVVWLLVDAPVGKSAKGLFVRVLSALDERLGTKYAKTLGGLPAERLEEVIRALVREYTIGVLVIDEAQVMKGSGVSRSKLIDHLVSLTNISGVPILLVGTSETREMLRAAPQLARRTIGEHPVWNALDARDEDWLILVDGMFSPRRLGLPFEMPEGKDLAVELHKLTEGISAILGKLIEATALRACRLNRGKFTLADCEETVEGLPDEIKELIALTRMQRLEVTLSEVDGPVLDDEDSDEQPARGRGRVGTKKRAVARASTKGMRKRHATAVVRVSKRLSGLADMRRL